MPGDEYSSAGGGGKLKLKGSKVSDGRIEKKKKKAGKKNQSEPKAGESGAASTTASTAEAKELLDRPVEGRGEEEMGEPGDAGGVVVGKTEAERKYEDAKKKRLQERLKREGVKTHKERVEDLNKYLSRLSEHHDMPKIGPG